MSLESGSSTIEDVARIDASIGARCMAVLEALAVGLVIGFINSCLIETFEVTPIAFAIAGAILGYRHAGMSSPCWPALGGGLYVAHVIVIALGGQRPYVEENYRFAEQCLWMLIPSGLGLLVGCGLRVALLKSGEFGRESGPPARFLPRSVRELALTTACIGVGLACLHRVIDPPTIYAPGYSEARFVAIREGMTTEQVLATAGPPLYDGPWGSSVECWKYSDQYTYESNFHRRWIFFEGGKVRSVVNDYWFD